MTAEEAKRRAVEANEQTEKGTRFHSVILAGIEVAASQGKFQLSFDEAIARTGQTYDAMALRTFHHLEKWLGEQGYKFELSNAFEANVHFQPKKFLISWE